MAVRSKPITQAVIRPIFPTQGSVGISTQVIDTYNRSAVATDGSPAANEAVYEYTLRNADKYDISGASLDTVIIVVGAYSTLGNQTLNFMLNDVAQKTSTIDTTATATYTCRMKIYPGNTVNKIGVSFTGNQICNFMSCEITGIYIL